MQGANGMDTGCFYRVVFTNVNTYMSLLTNSEGLMSEFPCMELVEGLIWIVEVVVGCTLKGHEAFL